MNKRAYDTHGKIERIGRDLISLRGVYVTVTLMARERARDRRRRIFTKAAYGG